MDYTANFEFMKPSYEEDADVAILNGNMDMVDDALMHVHDVATLCSTVSEAVSAGLISSVNAAISSSSTLRLYKTGRVVVISGMITTSAALADGDAMFNLAESVRPICATYIPIFNSSYRLYASKGISFTSANSGPVTLRLNESIPDGNYRFYGVYISLA